MGPDEIGVKISSKLRSVLADVRVEHILAVKNDVFPFDGADMLQETDVYGAPLPRRAVNKHPQINELSMELTLLRCDWISRRAAKQRSLLQILGLNVRKEGIASWQSVTSSGIILIRSWINTGPKARR
jgi:ribosomal protein L30/L7E